MTEVKITEVFILGAMVDTASKIILSITMMNGVEYLSDPLARYSP
jgi:hypothetical protein